MLLDDLATVEDVAADLGVAPPTLREWCRRGRFPHVRLPHSRRILIPRADGEAYLAGATLEVRLLDGGGRLVQPAPKRRTDVRLVAS